MNFTRILIIRPCAIGDFVHTLPAIRTLRNRFPDAYIEVLGNLSTILLANNRFYADKTGSFDRQDISYLFANEPDFPQSLIDYILAFDLVIAYLNDEDNTFARNIKSIGAKNIITYDPLPEDYRLSGQLSESSRHVTNKTHIIDHLLKPVISLGINGSDIVRIPEIYLSEDDRTFASDFFCKCGLSNNDEPIVAIHPGSGSKKKNWPTQNFVEVAKCLTKKHEIKLLVISGPADEAVVSVLKENINKNAISVLENAPLSSLAAVLARVDCFLGNDSGISHIAAAVGVSSLLIFGPTDPDVWAPIGDNVQVVRSEHPCSPCQKDKMRNCEKQQCLEDVKVKEVVGKILEKIGN
ncbi:MAG: glycosyltransferase family 9 protein [Candidatus Anammoxibacter sp.]